MTDEAKAWEDAKDEWSADIDAAFPTRSGSHNDYAVALEMVGHRHSKGELVSLVNWLLVERKRAEATLAERDAKHAAEMAEAMVVIDAAFAVDAHETFGSGSLCKACAPKEPAEHDSAWRALGIALKEWSTKR